MLFKKVIHSSGSWSWNHFVCVYRYAFNSVSTQPNARLVMFEHSGHAMLFDEPEKFNRELLTFLDGSATDGQLLQAAEAQRNL